MTDSRPSIQEFLRLTGELQARLEDEQAKDRNVMRSLLTVGIVAPASLLLVDLPFVAIVAAVASFGTLVGVLLWRLRIAKDRDTIIIVKALYDTAGFKGDTRQ